MNGLIEEYKGFDIELVASEIDAIIRYRAYNPQENYMLFGFTVDALEKRIDERYRSR